ncbi:MAG: hypothetical protein K2G13_02520, partial [Muribaculaceae bacterium]|nr:hypothetical protein [Muribaculaceae bacterium]
EKALELLFDSQSHLEDNVSPELRMRLYELLAAPYYYAYKKSNSKEYSKKAIEAAREADSLQRLPGLLWNLVLTVQDMDSVDMLLRECRDLSDRYDNHFLACRSRINLAKVSLLKGDHSKAESIIDSLTTNPDFDEDLRIDLQMQRALIYRHQNRYEEVINVTDSIQRHELSLDGKSNLYEILYTAARKSGRLEEALAYRDSLVFYQDSINSIKNSEKISTVENNFSQRMTKETEKQRLMWWIGGSALLLMICLIIFLSKSRAMKNRQLKLIEKISQLNSRLVQLENRDMETKETDTLSPVIEKFRLTKEFFFTLPQSNLVNVLNMTPNPDDIPKEKLKALRESVTGTFAEVCSNLRLVEKDVTQDDAWLCVCSYIGLNKDATGAVMCSSDDALRKRKSRIRQKLPNILFELFFCK